jgi:hypothetical protein
MPYHSVPVVQLVRNIQADPDYLLLSNFLSASLSNINEPTLHNQKKYKAKFPFMFVSSLAMLCQFAISITLLLPSCLYSTS